MQHPTLTCSSTSEASVWSLVVGFRVVVAAEIHGSAKQAGRVTSLSKVRHDRVSAMKPAVRVFRESNRH